MGEKKKNVLMICTDHWAGSYFRHCGCDVYTPTLDYLAENGIEFRNCYSECPVCIPARRTLMTGLVPRHHKDRVYSESMEMIFSRSTLEQSVKYCSGFSLLAATIAQKSSASSS